MTKSECNRLAKAVVNAVLKLKPENKRKFAEEEIDEVLKLVRLKFAATQNAAARDDVEVGVMVKITKLPPGKAIGADDLQGWSRQRNAGRSGVPDDRQKEKRLNEQKLRREKWLRKNRRKYPRKGLVDLAFDEADKA